MKNQIKTLNTVWAETRPAQSLPHRAHQPTSAQAGPPPILSLPHHSHPSLHRRMPIRRPTPTHATPPPRTVGCESNGARSFFPVLFFPAWSTAPPPFSPARELRNGPQPPLPASRACVRANRPHVRPHPHPLPPLSTHELCLTAMGAARTSRTISRSVPPPVPIKSAPRAPLPPHPAPTTLSLPLALVSPEFAKHRRRPP